MPKALVTGAARGIGRAIALELARQGHDVAIHYRSDPGAAEQLKNEIAALGVNVATLQADLAHADAATQLVKEANQALGGLDILVNNAGVNRDQLLLRMRDEDWDLVLRTDLTAAFLTTREALKLMIRSRYGRIINITSVVGVGGNAGQANYAAAKAGLIGFTYSVAKEYGERGITTNAVAPGFIETEMTARLPEEVQARYLSSIPARRFGHPEEVAHLVGFLASEKAGYINGQVICVDGGLTPH
jgi:3-oxoacyl-[acyl-carrier protein] reductase